MFRTVSPGPCGLTVEVLAVPSPMRALTITRHGAGGPSSAVDVEPGEVPAFLAALADLAPGRPFAADPSDPYQQATAAELITHGRESHSVVTWERIAAELARRVACLVYAAAAGATAE